MTQLERNPPNAQNELAKAPGLDVPRSVGVYPLSWMQESVWFVEQLAPGTSAYNLVEGWRLTGKLNPAALRKGLDELQRRHETLRTVFGQHDGKPMQIILEPQGFALELTDLSKGEKPEAELDASLRIEARRPFELTRGPLARANLYRLADEDHLLL